MASPKAKRIVNSTSPIAPSAETLKFINDLTPEEHAALQYFLRHTSQYKNLVLLAALHTLPIRPEMDGPLPSTEILDAVTCLAAALTMQGGKAAN